jgi:hypothetical protein
MIAQGAERIDDVSDDEILDADTSAAILRWMETALVPDGIRPDDWERWVDSGCQASLQADGLPVTPVMLGQWARSGSLR